MSNDLLSAVGLMRRELRDVRSVVANSLVDVRVLALALKTLLDGHAQALTQKAIDVA